MAALRDPQSGCPWDLEQNFSSIAPHTIEEAYEVVDAIDRNDMADLRDELGDLLLQVVFHAQMAKEDDLFTFDDVAQAISDKLERRHPHIFGDGTASSASEVKEIWDDIKSAERLDKAQEKTNDSPESAVLSGVALNLPALTRAEKIQKRARRVGFDWEQTEPVFAKVQEELEEVRGAELTGDQTKIDEEIGDLLFSAVNLARHLSCDPESALRQATTKFSDRFTQVEQLASNRGLDLKTMDLSALDALWDEVKT